LEIEEETEQVPMLFKNIRFTFKEYHTCENPVSTATGT
jgi:hypothetical protein